MSNLSKSQEFFAAYASKNVAGVRNVMAVTPNNEFQRTGLPPLSRSARR